MSRRPRAIAVVSLVAAITMVGAYVIAKSIPDTATPAGPQHVIVDSSWVFSFSDLHELKAGAIAVVLGTVTSERQLAVSNYGPNTPTMEFQIRVERTLKGSVPATIAVQQIGGTLQNGAVVVQDKDDPLLVVGERGVFFLYTRDATYYTLLDGAMGHFTITTGKVNHRGAFAPSPASIAAGRQPAAPIHGLAEADFIAQVLAA
jgi:hypothetical protein